MNQENLDTNFFVKKFTILWLDSSWVLRNPKKPRPNYSYVLKWKVAIRSSSFIKPMNMS